MFVECGWNLSLGVAMGVKLSSVFQYSNPRLIGFLLEVKALIIYLGSVFHRS